MAKNVQVGIIGAGSVFTPELVQLILDRKLDVNKLVLMDNDIERLKVLAGLTERQISNLNSKIVVETTDNYKEAIVGSDFILIQARIGGQEMRIKDEKIAKKYRLPFVETMTVPGLAAFLRTVPVYDEIAKLIKEHSPEARIMNFANPAGPLTAYLHDLGITQTVGVCNIPKGNIANIAELFDATEEDVSMNWKGLNHFAVADKVIVKGKDVTKDLMNKMINGKMETPFSTMLLKDLDLLISPYYQYYFHSNEVLGQLLEKEKTRGEEVKEIENSLLSIYDNPDTVVMPELLKERGGFKYSEVVVDLIESFLTNNQKTHYINVPNNGTISSLPDDTIVEVPVIIENGNIIPLNTGDLPKFLEAFISNMATVYYYWLEAIRTKEVSNFRKAMLLDPIFPDAKQTDAILKEVFETNENYIENFYK